MLVRRHSAQPTVEVAIGNQRQSLLASSANIAHLQMTIADMVHCDGIHFVQVGHSFL